MKKYLTGFWLGLILLASSWTLLKPGFFRVHDYVHAARIAEMTRALEEGHFPVRWSENFDYGYGMPLFEFYAPLPYYVGSFLYWSGIPILMVLKLLFLSSALVALVGSYRLGTKLFGRTGGLVTAAAFTLAPYRAVNLYIRGALSEAWGIMAMPWILLGIVKIIRREPHGWLTMVLGLVVLMLSHNLTTMMFVPLSGLFALGIFLIENWSHLSEIKKLKIKNFESLFVIAGSYLLSIGLSAFYLFPAVLEKGFTKIDSILGGYFDYHLHFLYIRQFLKPNWGYGGSGWGPDDEISFFLGWGQLIGLGVAVILVVWLWVMKWRGWHQYMTDGLNIYKKTGLFLVLGGLLGLSLFMTLQKTVGIWEAVPFLTFIQFPWRWLSAGIMFLALLVGFVPSALRIRQRYVYTFFMLLVVILGNYYYFRPERYLERPFDYYYTQEQSIREGMSNILQDYIPVQMPNPIYIKPPTHLVSCGEVACGEEVEVIVDRGHEKLIKTDFKNDQTIAWSVADFPGWYVEVDGQRVEKQQTSFGTIQVAVPAKEHLVGIKFGSTPVRVWSDAISVISVMTLLYLLIAPEKRHD